MRITVMKYILFTSMNKCIHNYPTINFHEMGFLAPPAEILLRALALVRKGYRRSISWKPLSSSVVNLESFRKHIYI